MAVDSFREVIGRSLSHQFKDAATAERKFICTLDATNTSTNDIIGAVGIYHLDSHPEYAYLKMLNATVTEGSPTPYHAEVTFSYGLPEDEDEQENPLSRADRWSFNTSGASVAAYYYFEGDGNNDRKVLVNSAEDFFEGAQADESECRATIEMNRATFPLSLAVSVTNCVNDAAYLGASAYHWKCAGINATQEKEVVNEQEVRYWKITVELVYRQTGWPLVLPDVGYNCMLGGEKVRAYVFDPDDGTKVACASPVALNEDGTIKENGPPNLLSRRVHRSVNFQSYFGTPPS